MVKKCDIKECYRCPFNYEFDMASGYGCRLDEYLNGYLIITQQQKTIKEDKKGFPETPGWCPLKKGKFEFCFEDDTR